MIRISRGDVLPQAIREYEYKFHRKNFPNFLEIDSQISCILLQRKKKKNETALMNIRIIKNRSFHLIKMIRRNETF